MQDDLESQAAAPVGQVILAFSRLDFMLGMALRNLVPTSSPDSLNPIVERLGFKERMDSLQDLVAGSTMLSDAAKGHFKSWYPKADRLRTTRNAFVHGRWGIQSRDTLFNASTRVGEGFTGRAKEYSLGQLKAQSEFAVQVLAEFHDWHMRNVLSEA